MKDHGSDFKCAVLLDPWMYAVDKSAKISIPLLNLQSHRFHWKTNLDQMKQITKENDPYYRFAYIKETRHQDASDFTLLYPKLMAWAKNGGENPEEIHDLQNNLINSFIGNYLQIPSQKLEPIESDRIIFGDKAFKELYEMNNY